MIFRVYQIYQNFPGYSFIIEIISNITIQICVLNKMGQCHLKIYLKKNPDIHLQILQISKSEFITKFI